MSRLFLQCKNLHLSVTCKSNRKAMNRDWNNQKANPALKTKNGKQINITNRQNTMRTNC